MRYSADRARYETELSKAHRALYNAERLATELNDDGAAQDCGSLTREITRLAQDSLGPKRRKPQIRGQMEIYPRN